ncbi:MAG TPA: hypothetical protein VI895_03805 [Bdellovibrionota bacterium]|nr:hypothetical protein [Bdellovibrionota bacterium]
MIQKMLDVAGIVIGAAGFFTGLYRSSHRDGWGVLPWAILATGSLLLCWAGILQFSIPNFFH